MESLSEELRRAFWSPGFQRAHFLIGLLISAFATYLVGTNFLGYWWFQARIIAQLLDMAHVPYTLFDMGRARSLFQIFPLKYTSGGPTFELPVPYKRPDPSTVVFILLNLAIASFIIWRLRKIPFPIKILWFIIAPLAGTTLLYNAFWSVPHRLTWITVDWSCSGVMMFILISVAFSIGVFGLKGPLHIKLFWMGVTMLFSIAWNVLRLAVTIATLYHVGTLAFLLLHYLAGTFIDFIYLATFAGIAIGQLAEAS
ncbi:MAG: hypothetical protein DRN92_05270 [Thermoproteota archaeon]|nr:MAG: hypothetical protein DRN92_05270 [Candidatus Korarchaeota archaeon]